MVAAAAAVEGEAAAVAGMSLKILYMMGVVVAASALVLVGSFLRVFQLCD